MTRLVAWSVLVVGFILPEILLLVGVIPYEYRHWLLAQSLIVMFLCIGLYRIPRSELGVILNPNESRDIAIQTVVITFIVLFLLALLPALFGHPRSLTLTLKVFVVLNGGVFFQELLCRGFAFYVLKRIGTSEKVTVWVSAVLYALLHLHFRSVVVIAITFVMGILWGLHYAKHRTIVGVSVAHAICASIFAMFSYLAPRNEWGWGF